MLVRTLPSSFDGRTAARAPTPASGVERTGGDQLKDEPQPQVRWAFGLSIENPAWFRPSL